MFRILPITVLLFIWQSSFSQSLAITNVSIIDVKSAKLLPSQTVVLSGDRITAIGASSKMKIPAGSSMVDGTGKYLMPGMVDAHIHFFQSGGLYTRPDAIDLRWKVPYEQEKAFGLKNATDYLARYMRLGITTVADVGGPFANFLIRDSIAKGPGIPDVLVTGPLFSMIDNDYFGPDKPIEKVVTIEAADRLMDRMLPYKPDFIKIWYIATKEMPAEKNYPVVSHIAQRTRAAGLRLFVHATELHTARLAVAAGANVLVHSIGDSIIPDDFLKELKAKGVVVVPTLIVSNNYVKVFAGTLPPHPHDLTYANAFAYGSLRDLEHLDEVRLPPIIRYMKQQGIPPDMLRLDTIQAANLKRMVEAGITIATGTDAGNIGTMHASSYMQELEAMHDAGMTPTQILTASTLHGAAALNRLQDYGSIELGKKADLLLLNENPLQSIENLNSLTHVVKGGTLYMADTLIKESPEAVVQRQLNAYNARDIEAFAATYSPDVTITDWSGKVLMKGQEALRLSYTGMFKQIPNLHCEIKKRMVQGNKVIDEERVRFGKDYMEAIAIYEVEKGKISKVTFLQ
jgi:imidazolonepropionase-like amidohydrolase